jgi:hypothetical protein
MVCRHELVQASRCQSCPRRQHANPEELVRPTFFVWCGKHYLFASHVVYHLANAGQPQLCRSAPGSSPPAAASDSGLAITLLVVDFMCRPAAQSAAQPFTMRHVHY